MTTTPGHGPSPDGVDTYTGSSPLGTLIIEPCTHTSSQCRVREEKTGGAVEAGTAGRAMDSFGAAQAVGPLPSQPRRLNRIIRSTIATNSEPMPRKRK